MKIRIKDNSIRLRLTRTEVETMRNAGEVVSHTGFADGRQFRYALESNAAQTAPSALFAGDEIRILLPEATVRDWADTEQVSIADEQHLADGESLSILVEKDFACLAPRPGEDESDMFDHPDAGEAQC